MNTQVALYTALAKPAAGSLRLLELRASLSLADSCSATSRDAMVCTTASAVRLEPPGEYEMEMTAGMHASSASCILVKER